MATSNSTGYGPPARNQIFTGEEGDYEIWEMRFTSYLRLQKLHNYVMKPDDSLKTGPDPHPDPAATAAVIAAHNAQDAEKNSEVFASLVQFLDNRSVTLIMRDARNDGRKALKILRDHYRGSTKPRIISMYCELTSLKLSPTESVTDYLLRAETCKARLAEAEETVSDGLLVAMCIKGLPESFSSFSTVIQQKDNVDFAAFKLAIKNFEENERARHEHYGGKDSVMNTTTPKNIDFKNSSVSNDMPKVICHLCREPGHIKWNCPKKSKKWCSRCKSPTHTNRECYKGKSSSKFVRHDSKPSGDGDNSFIFNISENSSKKNTPNDMLLIDCGATAHIINDHSKFVDFDPNFNASQHTIELADSSRKTGVVLGRGKAKVYMTNTKGDVCDVILENALYIPSYSQNIISVSEVTKKGVRVFFGKDEANLIAPNGTKFKIQQRGKLYYINSVMSEGPSCRTLKEWHETLGHLNKKDCLLLEGVVDGMKITEKQDFKCSTCIQGKMVQYRNHNPDEKAKAPLELVHSDLAGPVHISSLEGSKYAIVFTDDYTGTIFVYFLKNKSDASKATARFLADISPYGTVKRIRTDCGTEYINEEFRALMDKNRIRHETSAPYSAHQNGTAERSWRTLFEMARCLIIQAEVTKALWNHAVRTAAYIRNRTYSKRLQKTPYEAFTGKKPNIKNMHAFGTGCYAYKQETKKLEEKATFGQFVGYDYNSPAYLVYVKGQRAVRRVRCVEFLDTHAQEVDEEFSFPIPVKRDEKSEDTVEKPVSYEEGSSISEPEDSSEEVLTGAEEENSGVLPEENSANNPNMRRNPSRSRNKPRHLDEYIVSDHDSDYSDCVAGYVHYFYKMSDIPSTFGEAVRAEDSSQWELAMRDEMKSLRENETFELVPRPDKPVIKGRWVYTKKQNDENEVYKARFVAKGFSQIQGVDYHESFSPTAKLTSIRLLVNLAIDENLVIHSMDVKSAYLNAKLDCDVYMEQPEGFKVGTGSDMVLKLNKSLYGLKQSGRMWNHLLHSFLVDLGFSRSEAENCLYTRSQYGIKVMILVWVDDLIIAGSDLNRVQEVKLQLSKRFKMKDFGTIKEFLGIQFEFNEDYVKLHQAKYVTKVLEKFNMIDCNAKRLPCDPSIVKIGDNVSEVFEDNTLYRSIVGSLVYLSSCTRPDLSYLVTKLSERLENPTQAHYSACKYALRYLCGTIDKGLIYKPCPVSPGAQIIGYSDSDWGSSSDRKSFSGYCYQLSGVNSFVSWKCKKQPTVALSTCEAEYIAASFALQEGIFLRQLLLDLKYPELKINLYVDNRGAIELGKNPVHHQRSKHIDIRYHFLRQKVSEGIVSLLKVSSANNYADLFTKPAKLSNLKNFLIY